MSNKPASFKRKHYYYTKRVIKPPRPHKSWLERELDDIFEDETDSKKISENFAKLFYYEKTE
jgi:hypothetical protein